MFIYSLKKYNQNSKLDKKVFKVVIRNSSFSTIKSFKFVSKPAKLSQIPKHRNSLNPYTLPQYHNMLIMLTHDACQRKIIDLSAEEFLKSPLVHLPHLQEGGETRFLQVCILRIIGLHQQMVRNNGIRV